MGISRSNGITYNLIGQDRYGYRSEAPNAFAYTEDIFKKYGLLPKPSSTSYAFEVEYGEAPEWNETDVRDNLYLDEREKYAEQIADYGNQMFDLFDQYRPQLEHITENAGVSSAELAGNLADSGARYNASVDAAQAEAERKLQRMGVNPNSGRYAAMTAGNSLQKAAGYSMNQNQVRQAAKAQDMNERYQAGALGMQIAGQGANSYTTAGSMYGQMGSQMQSAKQYYDGMKENVRQFNASYDKNNDQNGLAAMREMFSQAQQRYNNGLQVNVSRNGFGDIDGMDYGYGF